MARLFARWDVAVEDALADAILPLDLGGASARSYATQSLERKGGWRVTLSVVDDVKRAFDATSSSC